ncbi:MAG: hypothetical protein RLZZ249_278 [Actinomycetota bacterium]|jgi:NDP-sugar pyrophosphorylase family protein
MKPELQLVIPMGGTGSRFAQAGVKTPKPMISVQGRPMIEQVLENFNFSMVKKAILVTRNEVLSQEAEAQILHSFPRLKIEIVRMDGVSKGPADTVRAASPWLDPDLPLLIANSDQLIIPSALPFMISCMETRANGRILTFEASDPKWSYVSLDELGFVKTVVEKQVISNIATVGVYFFPKTSAFLEAILQMEAAGDLTNGELYVAPAFNYLNGVRVSTASVRDLDLLFFGLGTPEDLNQFLSSGYRIGN